MPALSKKAKARALKAEKKELQRLSSNYGSAGSAHLFRERFAQAEATAVPKYASYVCCLLGAYFGFRLCFDYFKLELLYAAIGVPFGGYLGFSFGHAAGFFVAMGWMLPEPAPRDWNSGIHNYGTLHTFAVGDTVTIIGLTASSEQQLNGLSALVTAEDGKDRWLVQPMTSTALQFRTSEKIDPISLSSTNLTPPRQKRKLFT